MKEGTNINVPYINECPVSIECKVKNIIPLGTHDCFIAEVVGSHINKSLIDEKGKIHFEEADLITYCHGEYFKMEKEAIGSFGYSVAKKKKAIASKTPAAKTSSKSKESADTKKSPDTNKKMKTSKKAGKTSLKSVSKKGSKPKNKAKAKSKFNKKRG